VFRCLFGVVGVGFGEGVESLGAEVIEDQARQLGG